MPEHVRLSLLLRKELYEILRRIAFEERRSQRELVEVALESFFKKENKSND